MIVAIDTNCVMPGEVGGIENYTVSLIEALKLPGSPASKLVLLTRSENHDFFETLADSRTSAVLLQRPDHKGKRVNNWAKLLKKHPAGGRRTLSNFQRQKADTLRQLDVDLVHFPGNSINPLDLDLPVALTLHDLEHRHFPQNFTHEEIEEREKWWVASAFRADAILTTSNYMREDLQRQWRVGRQKVFVAPEALQPEISAPPAAAQILDVRERFGLSERFFIYPADVSARSNHEGLVRAFAAAELGAAQLILTGGGQKNSGLPELIDELHAEFNVRLAGRVAANDLRTLYHLATGLIFPSHYQAGNVAVAEAMACGCPVACSNVSSLPEEIGNAGLLFSPNDLLEIAGVMRQLAGNDNLRKTFGDRGRERAKSLGPQNFLRALSGAYEHAQSKYHTRKAA